MTNGVIAFRVRSFVCGYKEKVLEIYGNRYSYCCICYTSFFPPLELTILLWYIPYRVYLFIYLCMQTISIQELKNVLSKEQDSLNSIVLDVRTRLEHKAEHIDGVKNVPLHELASHVDMLKQYKTVYVHCRTGKRGEQAQCDLEKLGLTNVINIEGGIEEWKSLSEPTKVGKVMPLIQQVHLTISVLLLIFTALTYFVSPWFLLAFLGISGGLAFAGLTGNCGMAMIIARMPWNR